jgi:hypothetical protein
MAQTFFFPILFLEPESDSTTVHCPPFRLAARRWETTTFDLATLATRHKLHLPYQVMDIMLGNCNLEIEVEADGLPEAIDLLHTVMFAMCLGGSSPAIAPFAVTHSVNEYSGINSRDSDLLRDKLPPELRSGIRSDTTTVEVWPVQLSFTCQLIREQIATSPEQFAAAAAAALRWRQLEAGCPELRVLRDASQSAPLLGSIDQSLLHIWCGLEALFPRVSTEVSFRVALYLAQLGSAGSRRDTFKKVREAYNIRSRVAHGSYRAVSAPEWRSAWSVLMETGQAILARGGLPGEDELLDEFLGKANT